ncbi:MAG TPA: JAB domain-containing protein [Candidatus Limnocylindrales bacterium]|nr:JAB domain-containing protein [Candidatus Limnocylindrales bacterium]
MALIQPAATPAGRSGSRLSPANRFRSLGAAAVDDCGLLGLASGLPAAACRRLLATTDGLPGLATRDPAELDGVPGLSPAASTALAAVFEIGRRVAAAPAEPGWRIRTPADVADRLRPAMWHLQREELRVLLLTSKNEVAGMTTVYIGNLAGSSVRVGEVFRDAVRRQSAAIVVVHNHPSGDPTPSADDLRITGELADAGRLLDIELLDHVVVAARGWVSLRALGAA